MQFFKQLTDPALKRLYKFVLKRMIGRFLADDELDLDQLDVHFRSGKIELCDLLLDAEVLNSEVCEQFELPFRVKKGYLGSVKVTISYTSIMSESCLVEIDDIDVVLVPIDVYEKEKTMAGSNLSADYPSRNKRHQKKNRSTRSPTSSSSTSSDKKSTKKQEQIDEVSQEGLDFVASWIEQVTSKIKVTLSNICLRLEAGTLLSSKSYDGMEKQDIALLLRLQWAQFTDESASEVQSAYGRMGSSQNTHSMYGSMAASTMFGISQKGIKFRGISMELTYKNVQNDIEAYEAKDLSSIKRKVVTHPFLVSDATRQCYIQVKMSHYEALEAPALDADVFLHSIHIVLQPQLFPQLSALIDAFTLDPISRQQMMEQSKLFHNNMKYYHSICEQKPTWMESTKEEEQQQGLHAMTLEEFQRIEALLLQYRKTHEELQEIQRRSCSSSSSSATTTTTAAGGGGGAGAGGTAASTTRNINSRHLGGFGSNTRTDRHTIEDDGRMLLQPLRKISSAESVESAGLSDLENEEDDAFFDAETGLNTSIMGSGKREGDAVSLMAQSMYVSAIYGHADNEEHDNEEEEEEEEEEEKDTAASSFSIGKSKKKSFIRTNRKKIHVKNRFKFHLLECNIVLLYEDVEEEEEEEEEKEEKEENKEQSVSSSAAHPKEIVLPKFEGKMEHLVFCLKDMILSALIDMNLNLTINLTLGSLEIMEYMFPRILSMDHEADDGLFEMGEDNKQGLNSFCVMKFVQQHEGKRSHLSANLSAQIRMEKNEPTTKDNNTISINVNLQPLLFELDICMLDRMQNLLNLLEENENTSEHYKKKKKTTSKNKSHFAKLQVNSECVEVTLRFPMVSSDPIRFGQSSIRGLCEDKLVVLLFDVKMFSFSPNATMLKHQKLLHLSSLPWLSEFLVTFDQVKACLVYPMDGNQRSEEPFQTVLLLSGLSAKEKLIEEDDLLSRCMLKIRLQTPSDDQIEEAKDTRAMLTKETIQAATEDYASTSPSRGGVDDSVEGRIGTNGWDTEAQTRTRVFEEAAAEASQFVVEILLMRVDIDLSKPHYLRLMVLIDALLSIHPIDVYSHNQALLTRKRPSASYMSMKLCFAQGVLKFSDWLSSSSSCCNDHPEDAKSKALACYLFAFEQLSVFQVSQWMGQLTSRIHVMSQNVTLFEAEDLEKNASMVPVLYHTPYGGARQAPVLFVGVDILDPTQEMREMKLDLHFSHVTLRYDTDSSWLFKLIDMVLLEYPAPIIPLDSIHQMSSHEAKQVLIQVSKGEVEMVQLALPPKTVFTKLFVNFYDAVVDYAPPKLDSRVVLVLGGVMISSNIVTGAEIVGYKFVLRDLELYLTHLRRSYEEIDSFLFGKEYLNPSGRKQNLTVEQFGSDTSVLLAAAAEKHSSLMQFLETYGFLQTATLDFIEVFLRSQVETREVKAIEEEEAISTSSFPEMSIELTMGSANVYACYDSFNTLVEILSHWSEAIMIEEAPKDTTGYIGLDRIKDVSSVSVVTNLNVNPPYLGLAPIGTSGDSPRNGTTTKRTRSQSTKSIASTTSSSYGIGGGGIDMARSNSKKSDEGERDREREGSLNIMAEIEENAFGVGQLFGNSHTGSRGRINLSAKTDTEARLLRTKLEEIERQKNRIVYGNENQKSFDDFSHQDDQLTATELRQKYQKKQESSNRIEQPKLRINELVIENYYGNSTSKKNVSLAASTNQASPFGETGSGGTGTTTSTGWSLGGIVDADAAESSPWFTNPTDSMVPSSSKLKTSGSASSLQRSFPFPAVSSSSSIPIPSRTSHVHQSPPVSHALVGSLPEEQAARWLSPSLEPTAASLGQIGQGGDISSTNSDGEHGLSSFQPVIEEEEEETMNSAGAFPAASQNWWGFKQTEEEDVELSDWKSHTTATTGLTTLQHDEEEEDAEDEQDDDDDEEEPPAAMSMSLFCGGEDEGTEVELDFQLDHELQNKLSRLLYLEEDQEGIQEEEEEVEEEEPKEKEQEYEEKHQVLASIIQPSFVTQSISSPCIIPPKNSSSKNIHNYQETPEMMSTSPSDEPIARWYDLGSNASDIKCPIGVSGGLNRPPVQIFPHHVEIPIGGAAASLSFGEKESDLAIKSILQEQVKHQQQNGYGGNGSTPVSSSVVTPIVVKQVLLRNFNLRMRLFSGNDWTFDPREKKKEEEESKRKSANSHRMVSFEEEDIDSSTPFSLQQKPKREKLLDALLDNYVPNVGATMSMDDANIPFASKTFSSNVFVGSKSAPVRSSLGLRGEVVGGSGRNYSASLPSTRKRSLRKSGRKTEEMLELMISRIQLRQDTFNEVENQLLAASTVLAFGEIELLDYISTSQIRKVLCYWKSDTSHPRETGSSMMHLHLITVRPGPNLCEEHRLKIRFLPLRINLDQEVVTFLKQFVPESASENAESSRARTSFDQESELESDLFGEIGTELSILGSTPPVSISSTRDSHSVRETNVSLGHWFFQSVDIRPCKIKIDYRPNRIDYQALRSGDYLEIINLFVLEGMELVLRHVKMSGVDGWQAMLEQMLMSWVNDISRHQIHKCVASVSMPPLRSFANIGSGAADLILLPMEHYGKDRRLVRGIKKGAKSFLKSVTIETLNTASKVARGTQALLEHADDVVSAGNLNHKQKKYRQARIKRNSRTMGGGGIRNSAKTGGIGSRQYLSQQPSNATEGLYQAYDSLSRELHVAAKTIVAVPLVEYKKTGSQGYVRSVIRAVPVAVLRPMIGATEAMSKALIGVRNAVDPELKEDIENKFKDFTHVL